MTTLTKEILAESDPRLPLHRRLADALANAIRRGDFSPSTALPSESEIAKSCELSLGTVRQAMSHLRESGLIERRQGHGTFIKRADFSRSLLRFFRFGDSGQEIPGSEVLSAATVPAPAAASAALLRAEGEKMLRLERLRYLAGKPVLREELWLPLPEFEAIAEVPPEDHPNLLYPYYEERCGIVIGRASEELSLSEATPRDAELLGYAEGSATIAIERVATAIDGRPVELRLSRGDARTFRYRVEIS